MSHYSRVIRGPVYRHVGPRVSGQAGRERERGEGGRGREGGKGRVILIEGWCA